MEVLERCLDMSAFVLGLVMLSRGFRQLGFARRHSLGGARARARGEAVGIARSRSLWKRVRRAVLGRYKGTPIVRDVKRRRREYHPRCATSGTQTQVRIAEAGGVDVTRRNEPRSRVSSVVC